LGLAIREFRFIAAGSVSVLLQDFPDVEDEFKKHSGLRVRYLLAQFSRILVYAAVHDELLHPTEGICNDRMTSPACSRRQKYHRAPA
jgi:hypothetical protein